MIYRPPSEARSYLLQVTVGCSHNKCTFCSMYKDKQFHIRKMEDIFEDIEMARRYYGNVRKIFLCDGDALCLSMDKLLAILGRLAETFLTRIQQEDHQGEAQQSRELCDRPQEHRETRGLHQPHVRGRCQHLPR